MSQVCLDDRGRSSFRGLQQRFHLEDKRVITARVKEFPAYLYVFDIMHSDGRDVRDLPLAERKKKLGLQ